MPEMQVTDFVRRSTLPPPERLGAVAGPPRMVIRGTGQVFLNINASKVLNAKAANGVYVGTGWVDSKKRLWGIKVVTQETMPKPAKGEQPYKWPADFIELKKGKKSKGYTFSVGTDLRERFGFDPRKIGTGKLSLPVTTDEKNKIIAVTLPSGPVPGDPVIAKPKKAAKANGQEDISNQEDLNEEEIGGALDSDDDA